MERALKRPSPTPRKVPRNPRRQLRSGRAWSRKWLIRYFRKRSFCPPAFALGLRPAPGFPPPIAWNSISPSSDLIAVFIAVYGFLIFGLVSTADTLFIRASHCQCNVASHAIIFSVAFRAPFGATSPALSIVCAEVSACALERAKPFNPILGLALDCAQTVGVKATEPRAQRESRVFLVVKPRLMSGPRAKGVALELSLVERYSYAPAGRNTDNLLDQVNQAQDFGHWLCLIDFTSPASQLDVLLPWRSLNVSPPAYLGDRLRRIPRSLGRRLYRSKRLPTHRDVRAQEGR